MTKRILVLLFLSFVFFSICLAAQFKSGTLPLVDGENNPSNVVINSRQPLFSWENATAVSSFTVVISSDSLFESSGELWNFIGATTSINTINFITRIKYNEDGSATALAPDTTYYWQVTIYGDGTSDTASAQFHTVSSSVLLEESKFDLAVDWNNPFNPANQWTRFRFTAKDRDRKVKLRVFSISGELVMEWPEQTVLKDAWYSQVWDGKNYDGEVVSTGMYFVNLIDVGESKSITRRVAVVKK